MPMLGRYDLTVPAPAVAAGGSAVQTQLPAFMGEKVDALPATAEEGTVLFLSTAGTNYHTGYYYRRGNAWLPLTGQAPYGQAWSSGTTTYPFTTNSQNTKIAEVTFQPPTFNSITYLICGYDVLSGSNASADELLFNAFMDRVVGGRVTTLDGGRDSRTLRAQAGGGSSATYYNGSDVIFRADSSGGIAQKTYRVWLSRAASGSANFTIRNVYLLAWSAKTTNPAPSS